MWRTTYDEDKLGIFSSLSFLYPPPFSHPTFFLPKHPSLSFPLLKKEVILLVFVCEEEVMAALQLELKLSQSVVEPGTEEVGNGFETKFRRWLDGRKAFGVASDCCDWIGSSSSTSRTMMMESGHQRCSEHSEEGEGGIARRKLKLSKEQSCYLEESFKEHNTLNPKQKLAIAKRLNLQPRQVEVWFQNRRARTKLKQTEMDYKYLKRCCEYLSEENRRLRKEIQDLRALKFPHQSFHVQMQATALTLCSSCERAAATPENAGVEMDGFGIF